MDLEEEAARQAHLTADGVGGPAASGQWAPLRQNNVQVYETENAIDTRTPVILSTNKID